MVVEAEKNFKNDGSAFLEIDPFKKKENIQSGGSQQELLSPRGQVKPNKNGAVQTDNAKF
jgi:hypothetical protein